MDGWIDEWMDGFVLPIVVQVLLSVSRMLLCNDDDPNLLVVALEPNVSIRCAV